MLARVLLTLAFVPIARVLKKNPELVEQFYDKAAELMHDKNQGVMLSGITLMLTICALDPAMIEHYRGEFWGLLYQCMCGEWRALLFCGRNAASWQGG